MALTSDQRKLLLEAFPHGPQPSGQQTPEQAENFAVVGVRHACAFEGLAVPSEDEVRAALRELSVVH